MKLFTLAMLLAMSSSSASTVLLVDHVAVKSSCSPLAWEGSPLRLECHGIIFREGFDP